MKKLSKKRKKFLEIRSRKGLKEKKRNKKFRRERIKSHIGFGTPKQKNRRPRKYAKTPRYSQPRKKIYIAPENFKLLENTEIVLSYIDKIKKTKEFADSIDIIIIDMSKIVRIDIGAINLLLSAHYDISFSGLNLIGKLPVNESARKLFHDSGYLSHMKKINGESFSPNGKHDLILKLGREFTRNESIGKAIIEAMYFLTGLKSHYTPVYSVIMEMAPNSIEHAYEENEHWILGMHCDEENQKVSFTFTDNGTGIIKTLNRKYYQEISDKFLGKNVEVIKEAFNKKYGSRTTDINRNKGLPMIKKIYNRGKIKNLLLITDNVLLKFENDSGILLNNKFAGTFYYWEIDINCIQNE